MSDKRRNGRITGKHVRINNDDITIIHPRDDVELFFTAETDATLGVSLRFDSHQQGPVLVNLTGAQITQLHGALDWFVRMSDFEFDQLVESVRNPGEVN